MKLVCRQLLLFSLALCTVLCYPCVAKQAQPAAGQQQPKQEAVAEGPAERADIVAKIGDYVITKEQLDKSLLAALRPDPRQGSTQAEPVDAKTVLEKMIAEKAMVLEARKQNYLDKQDVQASVKRFKDRKLVGLLLGKYLQNRLTVTEAEIKEKLQADPNLAPSRAKAMVQRAKTSRLLNQYYSRLCDKFHLQKVSANLPRAVEIHERLLHRPKEPRKTSWISNSQIRSELTDEEKDIVLATHDKGKVTLLDWFEALGDMAPPRRPKDLSTLEGVERLLDQALRMPVLVAEAKDQGLDKDPNLLEQIREYEDRRLLGAVMVAKYDGVAEPNEQEMLAYFNKNKEAFGTPATLKVDQIWCQDLTTAQQAKAELDEDGDSVWQTVKQKYCLRKNAKPIDVSASSEGLFWQQLWKNDPNEIVGPIKGFYADAIKWRIVRILEKKPAELKEYSDDLKQRVKWRVVSEKRQAVLAKYHRELLGKYSYELYADRLKEINPLDIP